MWLPCDTNRVLYKHTATVTCCIFLKEFNMCCDEIQHIASISCLKFFNINSWFEGQNGRTKVGKQDFPVQAYLLSWKVCSPMFARICQQSCKSCPSLYGHKFNRIIFKDTIKLSSIIFTTTKEMKQL